MHLKLVFNNLVMKNLSSETLTTKKVSIVLQRNYPKNGNKGQNIRKSPRAIYALRH